MNSPIERIKAHADYLADVPHNKQFREDLYALVAAATAANAPAAVPCHTCEELRDNLADALGGRLHSVDEKSQVIENLLAMIGRISDACGISAEDQSVASGDEEILFAIEELMAAATAPAPAAVPDGVREVRYLTDERDLDPEDQHELIIALGGNGDWYVSVLPKGHRFGPTVRLCTSGGASSAVPGLCTAIAGAFRTLAAATQEKKP